MDKTIKILYSRLLSKNNFSLEELEARSMDAMFAFRTTINDGYMPISWASRQATYQEEKNIFEFIVRHKIRWTIK